MSCNIILTCRRALRKSLRFYCSATSQTSSPGEDEKKKKSPFIKNVLLGKYDKGVLAFPEILSNEKLKSLEYKYLALESNENKIDPQTVGALTLPDKELAIDSETSLSISEFLKIAEAVESPSVAVTLDISQNIIPGIIQKYGTKEQIEKYVKKLKQGQILAAFAFSEETTGSDLPSLTSVAVKKNDKWELTGKKTWISNGEKADVLLVLAKVCVEVDAPDQKQLAAFLVDREMGYSVEPLSSVAPDLGVVNVTFDGVDSCLIGHPDDGYNIGKEVLTSYKYFIAGCCSRLLKVFVSAAVQFVRPRQQIVGPLAERELILSRLGSAAATTYALDSIIYLMAGLRDSYEADIEVEAALVHAFLADNAVAAMDSCLSIMGSSVMDENFHLTSLRNEFAAAVRVFFSPEIVRQFAALYSLEYAGTTLEKDIYRVRRSLEFPGFVFRRMIKRARQHRDDPKLELLLYEELHPSLRSSADELEYLVLKCNFCVETLLERHAADVVNRQIDLDRLTTVLVDILAMTACLGRASRAYCTGIKFADDEIKACTAFCRSAVLRSRKHLEDILEGSIGSNDFPHVDVGIQLISRGGYFMEHPLVRNIQ